MFSRLTTPHVLALILTVMMWIFFSKHGEINRDGVLYLTQAKYFLENDLTKAMAVYEWPFFSFLIATLSSLGIELQTAAHLLGASLFLLASLFFILTVTLVSESRIKPIYPGLIVLTSIPLMDDYLVMVLRDHGMWAGFMIGVYGYLRWVNTPQWPWALFWQAGFIFGTLFRPECLIFNILLPFTHQFFVIKTKHFKSFIQSISIPLIGLLILLIAWVMFGVDLGLVDFTRLGEIITRPTLFLSTLLQPLPIEIKNYHLKVLIADFTTSFKYFFLSYVALYKWVAGLGLFHLALLIYAIQKRLISSFYLKALVIFFVISSIITIINLYHSFIIANRYWVMNFWVIYIFAAIGLGHLWLALQHLKHTKQTLMKCGLVSIIAIYFLNIVIDKSEEHFEQQAGRWVKENHADLNNIYFNQSRVAYYSGLLAFDAVNLRTATEVMKYRHLVIRYNRFSEIKHILNYQPIKHFPSQQSPKIIIYKRIEND